MTMKKEALLTTAVIALLLLNFGTLGFLFFYSSPHPPGPGRSQLDRQIVKQLRLDAGQQQQFEQLKSAHHRQMVANDHAYRNALENYFALLKNDSFAAGQRDSLQNILAGIQKERATVTFQHFVELKNLCSPEQKKEFDALLPELMRVILPSENRNNRQKNG